MMKFDLAFCDLTPGTPSPPGEGEMLNSKMEQPVEMFSNVPDPGRPLAPDYYP
jgi:hypothetical protein